tara:strand:- start:72 stop:353 length:282 start_codon:yes stop_codon:yes gene_type:complete
MLTSIKNFFSLLADLANYLVSFSVVFAIILYVLAGFSCGIWGLFVLADSNLETVYKILIFSVVVIFFVIFGWVVWKQIQIKNNEDKNIKEIEY